MKTSVVLALAISASFFAAPAASAQTYYMLDSVSVTASKLPGPLHKNTRTVTLIDSLSIASPIPLSSCVPALLLPAPYFGAPAWSLW